MGSIRVLLATAVILGHLPGYWGVQNYYSGTLHHYFMVQIFFVISGFYIALVLNEKYAASAGGVKAFYLNRYLRLMPAFMFITLITLGVLIFNPALLPIGQILDNTPWPASFKEWAHIVGIAIANLSLFGIDLVGLSNVAGIEGRHFLLVPQAWSLGCEIWFYILSPVIVFWSNATLAILAVASFLLRFVFYNLDLPFFPWQQRVFGTELMFFIFGIFSYRLYQHFAIQRHVTNKWLGHIIAITFAAIIMADSFLIPQLNSLSARNSLIIGLYAMLAIPFIFAVSRYSRFDRILGELSYIMYLWHILLGSIFQPYLELWHGFFLVIMSVLFSIPVLLLIEMPFEKIRRAMFDKHIVAAKQSLVNS